MSKNNRHTTRGNLRLGAILALSVLLLPATIAPSFAEDSAQQITSNQLGATTSPATPTAVPSIGEDNPTDNSKVDGAATTSGDSTGKVIYKPGIPITVNTAAEDLQPTDDVDLATKQFAAYPDNPEAAFLLAVALTRTSRVEEALQQVRKAKNLANKQGGPAYFDKMISSYQHMLEYCPDDNRIRYTLAWAYYMKAYMLSKTAQAAAKAQVIDTQSVAKQPGKDKKIDVGTAGNVLAMINPTLAQGMPASGKVATSQLPHLPSAIEMAPTAVQGEVRKYYDLAVKNLDDLLSHNPDDFLAREYRAHLQVEETGDLKAAMKVWQAAVKEHPQNPAAYFFLAEAYLKLGDLKESISNISHAIALRGLGM